jgi:hypothetical protein
MIECNKKGLYRKEMLSQESITSDLLDVRAQEGAWLDAFYVVAVITEDPSKCDWA